MISIKVPARICFFGDHQDYLGLPVIAGTINRFIELNAEPISNAEFQLELQDIQKSRKIPLDLNGITISKGDYLLSSMAVLKKKGYHFEQGYRVVISGTIPVNAGLSSSSALTVAWIRFLIAIQEEEPAVDDIKIGHWAYEAEVGYFNSPGGLMDQYTIAQQGLLYIDTKTGKTQRLSGDLGKLVVAESGISKKTLEVLKNARLYQEKAITEVKKGNPSFDIQNATITDYDRFKSLVAFEYQDHWYAAIHNYDITLKVKEILEKGEIDLTQIGKLMNQHQHILETQIGNTPNEMVLMMQAARREGALGAKTIGSGGGGCMVAMVTESLKNRVMKAFIECGAKSAYEVELTYPAT